MFEVEEEDEKKYVEPHWIRLLDGCPTAGPVVICIPWNDYNHRDVPADCTDSRDIETYMGRIEVETSA